MRVSEIVSERDNLANSVRSIRFASRTFPEFSVEWLARSLRKTCPENHVIVDPGGVVQPFMGWVGNEEVDINWDVGSDSPPVTVLTHRGEFNKG